MSDEESPFRQQLRADKEKLEARRRAEEAKTQAKVASEAAVADAWPKAKASLQSAIDRINSDFEKERMPDRFEIRPGKQDRDAWPVIDRPDVYYIAPNYSRVDYRAKIEVDVRSDGNIKVRCFSPAFEKGWKVSEVDEQKWLVLLEDIYRLGQPPN